MLLSKREKYSWNIIKQKKTQLVCNILGICFQVRMVIKHRERIEKVMIRNGMQFKAEATQKNSNISFLINQNIVCVFSILIESIFAL
jgi:hypothetical protein